MKKVLSLFAFLALVATLTQGAESKRLGVGDAIPEVTLRTDKDVPFSLNDAAKQKPAILIFYRGGWCPYCSRHLSGLAKIEKELTAAGYQLLAISPDKPSKLREKPELEALAYTLLSDHAMEAASAFGIAFKVGEDVLTKYKGYGIDLEVASGESHHMLPHPAVYVVDSKGIIRFAHVNEDYKIRLEPEKVLEAAKAALK